MGADRTTCRPAVRVIGDVLRPLLGATFLKKPGETARAERVRRVGTNNRGFSQAPFEHPGCVNSGHCSFPKFSTIATGRRKQRASGVGAESGHVQKGVEDVFQEVMKGVGEQRSRKPV